MDISHSELDCMAGADPEERQRWRITWPVKTIEELDSIYFMVPDES